MKPFIKNSLIIVGLIVVIVLLARFVFFKKHFEELSAKFDSMQQWQDDYRKNNPTATKEQEDAAFKAGIANIEVWQAEFKKDHPDATKAEMDAAFNAMFKKEDK